MDSGRRIEVWWSKKGNAWHALLVVPPACMWEAYSSLNVCKPWLFRSSVLHELFRHASEIWPGIRFEVKESW